MNGAHLHLMLIHFPVAGTILAVPLLLMAWWSKSEILKAASLAMVVMVGLLGLAAFLTGEDAEAVVRHLPIVTMDNIHEHELAAKFGLGWLSLDALLAALGLFTFWKHKKVSHWVFVTVTLVTIFSTSVLVRTAYLGGHIQHPETRSGFVPPVEGQK